MKNNKKLLLLITAAMLLASCGGAKNSSSNPIDSGTSQPESSDVYSSSSESNPTSSEESRESTSRRPIGGSSSKDSSSSVTPSSSSASSSSSKVTSSSSSKTSSSIDTSDDIPVRYKITLHADSKNEGLTVTAPSGAYADNTVTLTVNLTSGYILEYIRLYAPTASEGGVRVKADDNGNYSFIMPAQNVDIYYKGVKGYPVSFAGNHATAKLASDSAEYDLWGEGYPVYVCKDTVESGYYFKGFEVKDSKGNIIETWNDAVDQVGFLMPADSVTVTAIGEQIDSSLTSIAGTYSGGVAIDMNGIGDACFELVIGLDHKVKFVTDWVNTDWVGTFTYANNELNATVTNLSQDGYYTDTTRQLKVKFLENGKYLAVEFSSTTSTYRYMIGKTSEGLMAKKQYMSKLSNDDYTRAHRIVAFTALSGDFFTYVNPTRTSAEYHLFAFEKETGEASSTLLKDKTYIMKKADGTAFIEVSYDGNYITVAEPTTGGDDTGGDTGGETQTAPFMNKNYANSDITLYDEYGENATKYTFKIEFGATFGTIKKVSLTADSSGWTYPPLANQAETEGMSYTYDAETGNITVLGLKSGNQQTTLTYQENGTILYKGTVWRTDWADYSAKASNIVLREVA